MFLGALKIALFKTGGSTLVPRLNGYPIDNCNPIHCLGQRITESGVDKWPDGPLQYPYSQ